MHVDLIICALQVFLPTNSLNTHWFLVLVNPRRKEIQVLDSLFHCMIPKEVHNLVRISTYLIITKDLTLYVSISRRQLLIPLGLQVRRMEAHLRAAMRVNGIESNAWEDINVMQWPVRNINVPKSDETSVNNISFCFCFTLLISEMLI